MAMLRGNLNVLFYEKKKKAIQKVLWEAIEMYWIFTFFTMTHKMWPAGCNQNCLQQTPWKLPKFKFFNLSCAIRHIIIGKNTYYT